MPPLLLFLALSDFQIIWPIRIVAEENDIALAVTKDPGWAFKPRSPNLWERAMSKKIETDRMRLLHN